jgi:hypothetical protein
MTGFLADVKPDPRFHAVSTLSAKEKRLVQIRDNFRLVDVSLDLLAALEKSGKEFTPIERPKGYRRQRRPSDCFHNAADIALRDHNATFVEGVAWNMGCGFHHAWITLDGEHAIDQTWPMPGAAYFGIAVPTKQLAHVIARSAYYGSIITKLDGTTS